MSASLVVEGLRVSYGARIAVADISFAAPPGAVLGLIGRNGAGKTSVLDACSGRVTPTAGRVLLNGSDVTALAPAARARRGIGRTFQRASLFESLSLFDNVLLGWEAGQASHNPLRHIWASRRARAVGESRAEEALQRCGIDHLKDRRAGELSTGQRRLGELARIVAGGFSVLLLDEPSSGLDHKEKDRLAGVLGELVEGANAAVVVVEHDMELVASVCDQVAVVDSGRIIHLGPADDLRHNDLARWAYLGEERA